MKQRSLALNAILNTIRQFGAILFPLITFPYVSRVLQATNYGKYTFSNSIISYFAMIAALGITNYAIREGSTLKSSGEKLQKFSNQVFTINLITTLVAYLLLIGLLIIWPKLHDYRTLILIQSVMIFSNTIGLEWLYTIFEDFAYVTVRSLGVQFVALILMFIFVRTKNDYVIYAIITTFASSGANVFGFIYARKYIHLSLTTHLDFRKHIVPMLVLFFNAIAVTIYVNSDITLIGIFKGDEMVGLYNVAVRIYTIVKQVLNATVVVTLPRLSFLLSQRRYRTYNSLVVRVFRLLTILVVPAMVGLISLSSEIIQIIAGDGYLAATGSLQLLSLAILFSIFASFITTGILLPRKLEKKILVATAVGAIVNLLLNLVLIPGLGINGSAITTVIAEALVCVLSLWYSRKLFNYRQILSAFVPTLIGCCAVYAACSFSRSQFSNVYIVVIVSIVASITVYVIIQLIYQLVTGILNHN
ncbi:MULTISPECIES: flippase [Lactobacillaceae]|uniref:flippase n=1 Tax=Lactobacillaceae TaxID=33958 RepID=UPI000F0B261A|nr:MULTISPECIES: flippase [Lactobacillaceae]MBB1168559.1 flippase [Lacticaseibacillus paracasei]MQM88903.1 flippase [Lentilactobacillus buchneri]RNE03527.1 putative O-antigen transporter [Lacticaseibacillus paracasei]